LGAGIAIAGARVFFEVRVSARQSGSSLDAAVMRPVVGDDGRAGESARRFRPFSVLGLGVVRGRR
jgi:hypothetical protein